MSKPREDSADLLLAARVAGAPSPKPQATFSSLAAPVDAEACLIPPPQGSQVSGGASSGSRLYTLVGMALLVFVLAALANADTTSNHQLNALTAATISAFAAASSTDRPGLDDVIKVETVRNLQYGAPLAENRKQVLVTGGSGYIGSHTVLELVNAGYGVTVVDNLLNSHVESLRRVGNLTGRPQAIRFIKLDLEDARSLPDTHPTPS